MAEVLCVEMDDDDEDDDDDDDGRETGSVRRGVLYKGYRKV